MAGINMNMITRLALEYERDQLRKAVQPSLLEQAARVGGHVELAAALGDGRKWMVERLAEVERKLDEL